MRHVSAHAPNAPSALASIFHDNRALIGMVHVDALPGAPDAHREPDEIATRAAAEARTLADAGFDAIIIENMHDRPYVMDVGPEVVACMTRVGLAVRTAAPGLALGVQILSRSGRQTLAVAHALGAAFVRIENFAYAHVADEGLMPTAEAGALLRYRRAIGAERIAVFADVKKKHASHAITADLSLADACRGAAFFHADGVIVTGDRTGEPPSSADLAEARAATDLPIFVGSGATGQTLPAMLTHADGIIVGSALKSDGVWSNPLDPDRCRAMVSAFHAVRD